MVLQHVGGGAGTFFGVRRILPEFSQTYQKKNSIKMWPPKRKLFKLVWAPLGAIIAHIFRSLLRFSGILWGLSEILPRFPRIFPGFLPNQNFWGCACTLCTPRDTPVVQHKIGVLWQMLKIEPHMISKINWRTSFYTFSYFSENP